MSHYGTLRDYRFDPDEVDDIRGAVLFHSSGEKIAKIKDAVFDHESGQIEYLVADAGHDRNVLLPLDRVYRSTVDEENFETDLTRDDLERLPKFDDKALHDEQHWRAHLDDHRKSYEAVRERLEKEYKEKWDDGVVQHRLGSTHNITPEASELPAAGGAGEERQVSAADLSPDRMTGKFAGTNAPMFNSTPMPEPTRMRPAGTAARAEDAVQGSGMQPRMREEDMGRELPPRFNRFAEAVRSRRVEICGVCSACGDDARRAA